MSTSKIRRGLRAAAAALIALGLAACQSIPGSGPVQEGLANLDQAEQPVQFKPGGPMQGAGQDEIVRGFVRAAMSSSDDYAIAREFLTPGYAPTWDPTSGVFVDEGTQTYRPVGEDNGELSLTSIATVDADGALTPVSSGAAITLPFEFEQIGGEWRIASAPNGIILDRNSFSTLWTPRQLYFLSADDRLVPETRWFLNRATLSTQIVGELLEGPVEPDTEFLRTAFPSGTALVSTSVPISAGVAQIDLTPELLGADAATMELLVRQLSASLSSVPGLTRFELSVNGTVVDEAAVATETEARGSESMLTTVLRDGVFGTLDSDEVVPLPDIGEKIADLDPTAVTLDDERRTAAVVSGTGRSRAVGWLSESSFVEIDLRARALKPSLDPSGYVWSYADSDPGRILVSKPGGTASFLTLPRVSGRVAAATVSPGGHRLALLIEDGDERSAVQTVGIVRDAEGNPVDLVEALVPVAWVEGSPTDLDWVDEFRLVSLTRIGESGKITLAPLGQFATDAGAVPGAVSVSGGGGRALMRVLDADGWMFAPQGAGWQRQSEGVELIARVG
ncbi:GerMN domain-containing protein [Leucobacter weissii]|uniref:GerMN domain-containing protein n=1 Tax=Leucobacter weissii TaxID=1983706 RepID=A0A939S4U0_9MICO|nr:LpqB family beta-propeller domain-containing protein [Leucobacter weissii]MBO1900624.1 GerMN domain-containing protein [Leucobacter weissii]